MTYKQFFLACEGYKIQQEDVLKAEHFNASMNVFAYHDPKKLPTFDQVMGHTKALEEDDKNYIKELISKAK